MIFCHGELAGPVPMGEQKLSDGANSCAHLKNRCRLDLSQQLGKFNQRKFARDVLGFGLLPEFGINTEGQFGGLMFSRASIL